MWEWLDKLYMHKLWVWVKYPFAVLLVWVIFRLLWGMETVEGYDVALIKSWQAWWDRTSLFLSYFLLPK